MPKRHKIHAASPEELERLLTTLDGRAEVHVASKKRLMVAATLSEELAAEFAVQGYRVFEDRDYAAETQGARAAYEEAARVYGDRSPESKETYLTYWQAREREREANLPDFEFALTEEAKAKLPPELQEELRQAAEYAHSSGDGTLLMAVAHEARGYLEGL